MTTFSLLIKPTSADCNLRCEYCFYIDHLVNGEKSPRMSDEVLEKMIASYMQTEQNNNYTFGWQGGEPTLMGLKFFKKVIELQVKYAPPGAVISNGLQTNGTLISNELAKFFGDYKFLLGISLDGPPHLHNYYRKTLGKKPTHALVMQGIERLKQNRVEFNILTLVNNKNVKNAKEVYQYLCENGFNYHQYIPCVEFDESYNLMPYSITGKEWGNFLCDLFDQWIKDDLNRVSIRLFDSIIEYLVHQHSNVCYMGNNCCQYFVVEYNGNVYPCDFFVRDDLRLGNVLTGSWKDFLSSPIYQTFGKEKANWNNTCISCSYVNLCHGDCQKFRPGVSEGLKTLSTLCRGWKMFYTHTFSRFKMIADKIRKNLEIHPRELRNYKKIGRNEPCPCGSRKKYKNCCLR